MTRSRILLGSLALFAMVFVCYAPSLDGDFLWDDDSNVSRNPTLRNARGLSYIWTKPHSNQQYYPLTHTSFWVEYQLWGLWSTGYRITNLVLHALAATLLWTVLRRLSLRGAWTAAAIFALHPVHVETAAWITERKNLLSAVLYFVSLLLYLRYAEGEARARRFWALSLVTFVAALAAKTAVLTLPATILVLLWWKRGRLGRAELVPTLPMFAIGAVFGAITWWVEHGHVGAAGPEWDLSPLQRILVAGRAVWFYAAGLVFPFRLNFIYPRWTIDPGVAWQWLYPLFVLAVVLLLWRLRARLGRGPLAGTLCFLVTLAPAIGLADFYFQLYAFVQDHLQYLASAALIALASAAAAVGLRRVHARAGAIVAALVLALLGALSWQRSTHFTSEEALWTSTLERNPGAWMADINLGLLREQQGRLDEAAVLFRHAVEGEHPGRDKAHYNLARLLEQGGRPAEAEAEYERALAANPHHPDTHNNLGNLLMADGRLDEAIAHYRAAIEAEPRHAIVRYNLALRLAERGEEFEAERQLQEALRWNPGYADAADALARLLAGQGRHAEAVEWFRRVLLLDPERPEVHYNLALSLESLQQSELAERHYRAAIALDPDLAGAHNNLAIVLYHAGRFGEAWEEVRRYEALGGVPHPEFIAALTQSAPPR